MKFCSKNIQHTLLILLLVVGAVNTSSSQQIVKDSVSQQKINDNLNSTLSGVPKVPNHWWMLFPNKEGKYVDFLGGDTGTGRGNLYGVPDRFGDENRAVGLADYAHIELMESYLRDVDPKKGFTISFWMFINEETLSYSDSQIFYANDDPSDQNIFGMSIKNKLLSIDRYIDNDGTQIPWKLWFWDPIALKIDADGNWFQVILTLKGNTQEYDDIGSFIAVYLGKPDGTQVSRHNYFLPQNLENAVKWGFGNPNGTNVKGLSDFKVYNEAFTDLDAKAAFDSERPMIGNFLRLVSKKSDKEVSVADRSKSDNAKVWQYEWEGGDAQTWNIIIEPHKMQESPTYSIWNVNSNKVLAVEEKNIHQNGAQIIQSKWEETPEWELSNHLWFIQWVGIEEDGRSFYQIKNNLSAKFLDVKDGSIENEAKLQQWDWKNNEQQKWYIEKVATKNVYDKAAISGPLYTHSIINKHSGKLVNLYGDAFMEDLDITQFDWIGETNQEWVIDYVGFDENLSKSYYRILNKHTWKPIGVAFKGEQPHDKIGQYVLCEENLCNNVFWYIDYWGTDTNGPYYRVVNKNSGLVMQVAGNSTENNAILDQEKWENSDNDNQKWYIQPMEVEPPIVNDGQYYIQNTWSQLFLDASGGSSFVRLEASGSIPWTFNYLGNGKYSIIHANSNQALTYNKNSVLKQQSWTNTDNQKWYIIEDEKNILVFLNSQSLLETQSEPGSKQGSHLFFEDYFGPGFSHYRQLWKLFPIGAENQKN